MTFQNLKQAVKELSPQERILFVQYILDTIAADAFEGKDAPLSDIWEAELDRRSAAYKKGELKIRSWAEIKNCLIQADL